MIMMFLQNNDSLIFVASSLVTPLYDGKLSKSTAVEGSIGNLDLYIILLTSKATYKKTNLTRKTNRSACTAVALPSKTWGSM